MIKTFTNQPKPFYMIFMLEIWERFGYYALNTILAFSIFHQALGFEKSVSAVYYGAFFALIFGLAAVGGWVGDKILGAKRTAVFGLISLLAGYVLLGMSPSLQQSFGLGHEGLQFLVFLGLALVASGSAFFKANPSNLLAMAYQKNDTRLQQGFTLFYMAINIGSLFADFFSPVVASHFGWNVAMYCASVGIVIALANFYFFSGLLKGIATEAGKLPLSAYNLSRATVIYVAVLVLSLFVLYFPFISLKVEVACVIIFVCIFLYHMFKLEDKHQRMKMVVALILMVEAVMFFILYSQKGTLLNLYAIDNVNTALLGINLNPQSFQGFNPFWIIVLAPFVVAFYDKLAQKGIVLSFATKFCLGLTVAAIAYLTLYVSHFFADSSYHVGSGWMVLGLMFYSLAELLLSAMGLAMIAELVPNHIRGFVMGMWFLSSSLGGMIGSNIASYIVPNFTIESGSAIQQAHTSLDIYAQGFWSMFILTAVVALFAWLLLPWLNRALKPKSI